MTDPLTGIFNRLKLDDTLNREIERVSRYPQNLSIILFDIDQFKQINDKYGHLAGDSVLVDIANTTASRTREIDIAGRWGGEEFLVICPETDLEGARRLAEDMRIAISEHAFSHERPITCSFGVASFHVSESVTSLIKRADEALYRAKGNGRNRVETSV